MQSLCTVCKRKKNLMACSHCGDGVCSSCVEHVDAHSFPLEGAIPAPFVEGPYCFRCVDSTVVAARENYEGMVARAKQVNVVPKGYFGHVHAVKTARLPISAGPCADKKDVELLLAYQAAKSGFNAIVKTEIKYKKINPTGYQTYEWSGVAIPATIHETLGEDEGDNPERFSI